MATLEQWIASAPGKAVDPDGVAGYQCVDVPKAMFQAVTGKNWREGWPGAGNAKDMLDTASTVYFDVIRNDPSRSDLLPRRGDVVVWGGSNLNPYGHIAVCLTANQDGGTFIQQDGFRQSPAWVDSLAWDNPGTGMCLGWLRLKPKYNPQPSTKPTPKESTMKPSDVWAFSGARPKQSEQTMWNRIVTTSEEVHALVAEVKALRAEVAALKAGK